jgi:hypothetical protein
MALTRDVTLAEFSGILYGQLPVLNMTVMSNAATGRDEIFIADVWSGYAIPDPWFDYRLFKAVIALEQSRLKQGRLSEMLIIDCLEVASEVMHPKSMAYELIRFLIPPAQINLTLRLYVATLRAANFHLMWDIFWWVQGKPIQPTRTPIFTVDMHDVHLSPFSQMWAIIQLLGPESAWVEFDMIGAAEYENVYWFVLFVRECTAAAGDRIPNDRLSALGCLVRGKSSMCTHHASYRQPSTLR